MSDDSELIDAAILEITSGTAVDDIRNRLANTIGEERAKQVVDAAQERIGNAADVNRRFHFGTAIRRLESIYQQCEGQEPNIALAAQKEINKLLALYVPKDEPDTTEHDSGDDSDAVKSLELIKAYLLPLELIDASYPIEEHVRYAADLARRKQTATKKTAKKRAKARRKKSTKRKA